MSNNIFATEQYSFHENVSRESAIFKLIELIFSAWNIREYIIGLFCDTTKAFDCVRHELLILKLEFYGVKSSILNWFKSYLLNRRQFILQFANSPNVYINNFPCITNKVSYTILFAEDTNIIVSSYYLND